MIRIEVANARDAELVVDALRIVARTEQWWIPADRARARVLAREISEGAKATTTPTPKES